MGIFPALAQDQESMRLWCLGMSSNYRSYAEGDYDLDGNSGRLVGVTQKAQVRQKNGAPQLGLEDRVESS